MADEVIELSAGEILQRHEDRINTLVDAVTVLTQQVTTVLGRVVDLEKRQAITETDQRDLERATRDSLDQIGRGMSSMLQFMREHRKPVQSPGTGFMN